VNKGLMFEARYLFIYRLT